MADQAEAAEAPPRPGSHLMARWAKRVALVTGASRGIGLAITNALVREGMVVIGVAQDTKTLEELALEIRNSNLPGSLVVFSCDVSEPSNVQRLFASIKSDPDLEGVDVCINNAGIAYSEPFLTGDPETIRKMFDVNVLGAAYVTQEAYKSMLERNVDDGYIIFLNSLAGHRIAPGNKELHVFAATKHAVSAMVEGIRLELRGVDSKIRVSSISPGVVETDIYIKLFEGDEDKAKTFLSERRYLDAWDVARTIVFMLSEPTHVQVHDIMLRSVEQIP